MHFGTVGVGGATAWSVVENGGVVVFRYRKSIVLWQFYSIVMGSNQFSLSNIACHHDPSHHRSPPPIVPTALPLIVPHVARLDPRVQALHHEVMEIGGEARNVTMQIQHIHEEQEHHTDAMLNLQAEQENITDRLHSLEEEMATEAEARAVTVEQRAEDATREMCEMAGHHVRHFGV
ncbi:unnamed protein product [Lactuca saligna]|uniref:Uncharacterized protein n=1 Tax=Lactuca saligna TaxID=75948 RepID=A0AA35YMF8_LACSI|nr:unnamed protein product [Lactuca saligna]